MDSSCKYISYEQTGFFSKLVLDYLAEKETVRPFYKHPVSLDGIKDAIEERKHFNTDRPLLVSELKEQYKDIQLTSLQLENLDRLLSPSTFTICTAHQPNIFTGHLYFIYKIFHTIKLAQTLAVQLPQYNFVPVFYMGSEDADLDELGHINLNGQKLEWKTEQTGAVGRMKVDKAFLSLIERLAGELSVLPHGAQVINLFRESYRLGTTIQEATLRLVNQLFKDYGLLVIIPDNSNLKRSFETVVKRELVEEFSHPLVVETSNRLNENYKAQASGREINLFYLVDGVRERIIKNEAGYWVSRFNWTEEEILKEVEEYPERFSANVILRGLFQETILPNIAFIGGGGEIAYWLQLKSVFENTGIPFPVLIVRNSFLIIEEKLQEAIEKLGLTVEQFFKSERSLLDIIVENNSQNQLHLPEEKKQLQLFYNHLNDLAVKVNSTLGAHVSALHKTAAKKVDELEKKMLRAEKRKYEAQQRQLSKLKQQLFPSNTLQERVDNFSPYYAQYGKPWMQALFDASLSLEQQFCILKLSNTAS